MKLRHRRLSLTQVHMARKQKNQDLSTAQNVCDFVDSKSATKLPNLLLQNLCLSPEEKKKKMKSYLLFTETKTEPKAIKQWRMIPGCDFFFFPTRKKMFQARRLDFKDPLPIKEPVIVADE